MIYNYSKISFTDNNLSVYYYITTKSDYIHILKPNEKIANIITNNIFYKFKNITDNSLQILWRTSKK